MDNEPRPYQIIQNLAEQRKNWTDEQILAELKNLPTLPDEDDTFWDEENNWDLAYLFMALADVAAKRKLQAALPLLLQKASFDELGEMMRGLRHQLEAIVNPNWEILTEVCMQAAHYPEPGARLWAITELGVLRDANSFQTLITALQDAEAAIRMEAAFSLRMFCQTNDQYRESVIETLKKHSLEAPSEQERNSYLQAIKDISTL